MGAIKNFLIDLAEATCVAAYGENNTYNWKGYVYSNQLDRIIDKYGSEYGMDWKKEDSDYTYFDIVNEMYCDGILPRKVRKTIAYIISHSYECYKRYTKEQIDMFREFLLSY